MVTLAVQPPTAAPAFTWPVALGLICALMLGVLTSILLYRDARNRGYSRLMALIICLFPPSLGLWCLFRPEERDQRD